MSDRFFCDLLSFRARNFPVKYETREPGKIIVECTLYIFNGCTILVHICIHVDVTVCADTPLANGNIVIR